MNYLDILNKYSLYYEDERDQKIAEAVFNEKLEELDMEDPRVKSIVAAYELKVNKNIEKFKKLSTEIRESGHLDAEFNIFNYALECKNYKIAEFILEQLKKVNYKPHFVMLSYGNYYREQDNIEIATEYYKKALEMGAKVANLNLASIYNSNREYTKAIECLKILDFDIHLANYLKGLCYINMGNDEEFNNIIKNTNIGGYGILLKGYKQVINKKTEEMGVELLKEALEIDDIRDTEKKGILESLYEYNYDKKNYYEIIMLAENYEKYLNPNSMFRLGVTYFITEKKEKGLILIYTASTHGCEKAIQFLKQIMENYSNEIATETKSEKKQNDEKSYVITTNKSSEKII